MEKPTQAQKTPSSSHTMRNVVIGMVAAAIIAASAFVLTKATKTGSSNKINVVAAENFYGSIVSQIGGDHVNVTSIITDPSADPHLYESDARDASAIASANVVVINGLGYDDFMSKLLAASPKQDRQVLTAADVLNISGADANPHVWYDVPRIHQVAEAIESALAAKDPADKATFEQNLTKFNDSLQPVLDTIAQIKSKHAGAPVAYTERVPQYLLDDAGLTIKTPPGFAKAIEDGNEPSPADTQAMQALITGRSIKVLLYNSQATSPTSQHVRDLANQANIPIIGVTETLSTNEPTYQSWQLDQSKALLKALGN